MGYFQLVRILNIFFLCIAIYFYSNTCITLLNRKEIDSGITIIITILSLTTSVVSLLILTLLILGSDSGWVPLDLRPQGAKSTLDSITESNQVP